MTAPGTTVTPARQRRLVRVTGVVQGVGFRPFVHALARRLDLCGHVGNDTEGVFVDVTGSPEAIDGLCRALLDEAPPLAVVESVVSRAAPLEPAATQGFRIVESVIGTAAGSRRPTLVPPDMATCAACLAELTDPADRRYRHPFITCTHCGPRYTIVTGLPYDRPTTTMAGFALCADCSREYHDPADRRFHAQPVSCHACGPRLELVEPDAPPRPVLREAALQRARQLLAQGLIVAVKGIGGYHLACDAGDEAAVRRLRDRKQRGDKPFAVLVRDLAAARQVARVDDPEAERLTSPRCPIVLLRRLPGAGSIARAVAPGTGHLGLMLPPSALHHLLLGLAGDDEPSGPQALVLTSGNLAGEPIVTDDDEALARLAGFADAWLRHDRPIHVPCDDSVTSVVDGEELPIRRSRGYAPMPIDLPVEVEPSMATGGDLKNTVAVGAGRRAWLSGHIGDLDDLVTQRTLEHAAAHLQTLVEVEPIVVVADRHPRYRSTAWARRQARATPAGEPVLVQHHHAHVAAVMAEHGLVGRQPVLGFAFDGTGYGTDGAIWGGEGLVVGGAAGYGSLARAVHLGYVPLPGGDASVERVYRMALAHLWAAGIDWDAAIPAVAACSDVERPVLRRQLETGLACVPTSSMGRLFDAVAALAGVCQVAGYEAQAAIQLQAHAEDRRDAEVGGHVDVRTGYPLPLRTAADGEPATWDVGVLVRAVVDDVLAEVSPGAIALSFHRGIAEAVAAAARLLAPEPQPAEPQVPVVLGGGVFANALLLHLTSQALRENGFAVLRPRQLPPNDGGLAIGQLVVGSTLPPRTTVTPRRTVTPRPTAIEGSTPCA